jgi:predicted DNA binding CopG/RHH family protein
MPDFNPTPFDDEERDLMDAFEAGLSDGSVVSHLTPERQAELQAAARATMNPPKKQISTRLAERDLVRLKAKALEQGMPYQSLLASIVHRYVEGGLVEKE